MNHDMMTSDDRSCSLGSRSSFLFCTLEAPEANLKPEIPARIPLWASKEVAKSCMYFSKLDAAAAYTHDEHALETP